MLLPQGSDNNDGNYLVISGAIMPSLHILEGIRCVMRTAWIYDQDNHVVTERRVNSYYTVMTHVSK